MLAVQAPGLLPPILQAMQSATSTASLATREAELEAANTELEKLRGECDRAWRQHSMVREGTAEDAVHARACSFASSSCTQHAGQSATWGRSQGLPG